MTNSNNDSLIFAHVIFRHGHRNIACTYPNDPYKDDVHWPEGFGQMTNEGKRQLYRFGQYLRRRYDTLIGRKYSPKVIYVQSTDFDRTIISAQCCLAGLFPPTDEDKWNDDIMWNPIPVHTIPFNIDYVLNTGKHCPAYDDARRKYIQNSPEIQRIYSEYANLFDDWSRQCGSPIDSIDTVFQLYSTLITEKQHNKRLPEWAEDAIQTNGIMEHIAKLNFKSYADTSELARLKCGTLIKEIMERFKQKINSSLQPDRSLWLYSAHDLTIANVLNSFGLFELHLPPYAASVHLELYKTKENEHYFQIFYRTSEKEHPVAMNIPGCGDKCSLDQFYEFYEEIVPSDVDGEE